MLHSKRCTQWFQPQPEPEPHQKVPKQPIPITQSQNFQTSRAQLIKEKINTNLQVISSLNTCNSFSIEKFIYKAINNFFIFWKRAVNTKMFTALFLIFYQSFELVYHADLIFATRFYFFLWIKGESNWIQYEACPFSAPHIAV